jgi:hypothetical protein
MKTTDIELVRLRDFQPTSFDCKGLGSDEDNGDWLVCPVVYHPNIAGILEESNWNAQCAALAEADEHSRDGSEEGFDIMRFGHWATPFQIAIVKPGSAAHRQAQGVAARLADYPVLDEQDYCARESEAQHEAIASELRGIGADDSEKAVSEVWRWLWSERQEALEMRDEGCRLGREDVDAALEGLGWVQDDEGDWSKCSD